MTWLEFGGQALKISIMALGLLLGSEWLPISRRAMIVLQILIIYTAVLAVLALGYAAIEWRTP